MTADLIPEQLRAVEGAVKALRSGGIYRIGGYAGTGKTTVIREIIHRSGMLLATGAFCGKAASVLRSKGVKDASTLHSHIYNYCGAKKRFILKSRLDEKGFIIDEGSMVPRPLWNDIASYRLPCIIVGDPGQLEPVGDDARLLDSPDIVLEHIHRNQGSIAAYAEGIRRTGELPYIENEEVSVRSKERFRDDYASGERFDVYLCGFNKTRVAMNWFLRGDKSPPRPGDKIVILKNDHDLKLYNGSLAVINNIHGSTANGFIADITCEDRRFNGLEISRDCFGKESLPKQLRSGIIHADYGYCLTTHKFQGSEDERVCYFDEQCSVWSPARHRYTGATRAISYLRMYRDT